MKRAALVGLLALAVPARADEWTATDTALQLTMVTLQVVDWGQTRALLDQGWQEWNPILGRQPSRLRLNVAVGGAILGHALVSYVLPQPWRRLWQVGGIGVELVFLANNAALVGLSWTFPL